MRSIFLGLSTVFYLSGCGETLEVSVKDRWKKSIRNYALQAIYPMREDVYVGTLRLVVDDDDPFDLASRSLGYIDMSLALVDSEARKPNYPRSDGPSRLVIDEQGNVSDGRTTWLQPTETNALRPTPNTAPNRLRLAALPGVAVVRVTEADLGRRAGLFAAAASYRDEANLNIDLTGIESMEIDDILAYEIFRREFWRRLNTNRFFAEGVCASAATLKDPTLERAQVQMVTRVFYARGIRYSYGTDVSAALRAATGSQDIIASENVFTRSTTTAGQAVDGQQAATETTETSTTTQGENATVETADLESISPGTTARIATQSEKTTSLTEIFERPLAFGVSTIAIPVKRFGIECDKDGRLVSPVPVVRDQGQPNGKGQLVAGVPGVRATKPKDAAAPALPNVGAEKPKNTPLTGSCQDLVGTMPFEDIQELQRNGLCG